MQRGVPLNTIQSAQLTLLLFTLFSLWWRRLHLVHIFILHNLVYSLKSIIVLINILVLTAQSFLPAAQELAQEHSLALDGLTLSQEARSHMMFIQS